MSDDADKATAEEERAWEHWHRQREHQRRAGMAQVLKRVAFKCLDCDCEIPHERVLAMPMAVRCVRCAAAVERDAWT